MAKQHTYRDFKLSNYTMYSVCKQTAYRARVDVRISTGIVEYNNPALLCAHGGPIELGKKWADSILGRMDLVKRKATKAARKLPVDFADVKLAYLQRQL